MSKALTITFILSTSLLLNINTTADIYSELNKCIDIQRSIKRLGCFDSLSKKHQESIKSASTSGQDDKMIKNQDLKVDNSLTQQSSAQTQAQVENQPRKSSFGLDAKESENDSVESNLIGQFSSWKKDMELHLQNGQVWKVVRSARGYKKLTNPKITISNGLLGAFNAKVEGLNSLARVKRIK